MTSGDAATGGADWQVLSRLFAEPQGAFRHRMGVTPAGVRAFYQPTGEAVAIRREKEAILGSPQGGRHFLETPEGETALQEFTRLHDLPDLRAIDRLPDVRSRTAALTLALEPDWLLLVPPDWRLVWASVCFPTRWSLAGLAGRRLPEIHAAVPGLNRELGHKIDIFFNRLPPGEGWARANWGLSASAVRNQHPDVTIPLLSDDTPVGTVVVRVEAQLFCKLPQTGVIAFGIRILKFPLPAALADPAVAAGLRSQLQTMPPEVAAYKGIPIDFWRRL